MSAGYVFEGEVLDDVEGDGYVGGLEDFEDAFWNRREGTGDLLSDADARDECDSLSLAEIGFVDFCVVPGGFGAEGEGSSGEKR